MTEEETRYGRNERRKELEAERDYYNAYYFGYANLPTTKEARHIDYMKHRDDFLRYLSYWRKINPDYMKTWYQNHLEYFKLRHLMRKKKDYFMKKGFLNDM